MDDQEQAFKEYWAIILKFWWILALGVFGTAITAYFLTGLITPNYESTTKILVQGGQSLNTPFLPEVRASQELAQTYRNLIKTRPILEQVAQELSLPYGPITLGSKISTTSDRSLIQIKARDPDPAVAADISATVASVFIDAIRNRQFFGIAQFQAALKQSGFVDNPSIIAAQTATLSTLIIVEEAVPASFPSSPRPRQNTIFGGILGLLSACLLIFMIEYLNDQVKSPNEVRKLTGINSLVSINRYPSRDKSGPTILDQDQRSGALAETFKFLSINLDFAADGQTGLKSLLVTSSVPGEGKTTTAVNLAITLATMGRSVILIDTDLRRPNLHRIFSLQNEKGLSQVLIGTATLDEALTPTSVTGLQVVPGGNVTMDITALLRTTKLKEMVDELKSRDQILILDSSPLISVADTMLLAPVVDGVLFVVDAHNTSRANVRRGAEILEQAQISSIGAVFNKAIGTQLNYYNYTENDSQNGTGWRSKILGVLKR